MVTFRDTPELRNCVNVEVDVLGSPSLIVRTVSVDLEQHSTKLSTELRSCVNVEVAFLGSPSLISLMVSVDVELRSCRCERRGGRPGLPVPNKPDGFCGRKAA